MDQAANMREQLALARDIIGPRSTKRSVEDDIAHEAEQGGKLAELVVELAATPNTVMDTSPTAVVRPRR